MAGLRVKATLVLAFMVFAVASSIFMLSIHDGGREVTMRLNPNQLHSQGKQENQQQQQKQQQGQHKEQRKEHEQQQQQQQQQHQQQIATPSEENSSCKRWECSCQVNF
jgi:uncharacterized membrane protein YhiD involved in acid resistance